MNYKRLLTAPLFLILGFSHTALANNPTAERLEKLEQEINILKRQLEVDKEEAAALAQKTPIIEYGKKGLKIASKDGQNVLQLRGYAHFDNRSFINDDNRSDTDSFLVRRARPIIEGQAGNFALRIMPDFAGGTTRLFDAWVDYKHNAALNLRIGKFKAPVGLDHLKSRTDITFVEASLPTNLVSNRDIGVMAFGNVIPEIEYQLAILNGGADRAQDDVSTDDDRDFAARVFAQPFKLQANALSGLGFGVGGTWGERDGSLTSRQLGTYVTPGQATFFQYGATTFAKGTHWRLAPQAHYYNGPLGLLAEYTISAQDVQNGTSQATIENKAWEAQVSYVLTGEDATYKSVIPAQPFNPSNGTWGAWEIAAKVGQLDIDDQAFPIYANPGTSASHISNYGAVINGYLNENIKVSLDYEHSNFDGGSANGTDREDEQVILTRIGYKF